VSGNVTMVKNAPLLPGLQLNRVIETMTAMISSASTLIILSRGVFIRDFPFQLVMKHPGPHYFVSASLER